MFQIDPTLIADTHYLGDLPLSALLMSRDANYPWCILVPRLAGLTELHQLDRLQREQLMAESCLLGEIMQVSFDADKMNVAALGNVVSQLHVHHIVRYHDDAAWPAPVWGVVAPAAYDENSLQDRVNRILSAFADEDFKPRDWR